MLKNVRCLFTTFVLVGVQEDSGGSNDDDDDNNDGNDDSDDDFHFHIFPEMLALDPVVHVQFTFV